MKRILAMLGLIALLARMAAFSEAENALPAVAAEGGHALYLDEAGTVWAWGSNQRGESSPFSADARVTTAEAVLTNARAIACGQQFSMAIDDGGALLMWGDNRMNQIPTIDGERASAPVKVAEGVAQISACDARAALVTADGRAYLWGDGREMALVSENASMIFTGTDFALVLLKNGDVMELNDGAEAAVPLRGCVSVSASGQTRLAVTAAGELFAWGANGEEGRLGLDRGGWIDEPMRVPIPAVARARAGLSASAALSDDGKMWIWGALYSYAVHMTDDGDALGAVTEGELIHYGSAPVRLYENVRDIAFGDAFAAALMNDGTLLTWGSNDQGQIGDGTYTQTACEAAEADEDDEVFIVVSEQRVFPVPWKPGA